MENWKTRVEFLRKPQTDIPIPVSNFFRAPYIPIKRTFNSNKQPKSGTYGSRRRTSKSISNFIYSSLKFAEHMQFYFAAFQKLRKPKADINFYFEFHILCFEVFRNYPILLCSFSKNIPIPTLFSILRWNI